MASRRLQCPSASRMSTPCYIFSSIMLTWRPRPHLLSRINWQDPKKDPIFRQFIPLKSIILPNHPKLRLDSLGEKKDEVVKGLVHRYPDKALFLGEYTNMCAGIALGALVAYAFGSGFCVPDVLYLLYSSIRYWSRHRDRYKGLVQTWTKTMGRDLRLYRG